MKKKILILAFGMILLVMSGCGKKSESLADTLINENPGEIKGEMINISTSVTDSDTDSIFSDMSAGQSTYDAELPEDSQLEGDQLEGDQLEDGQLEANGSESDNEASESDNSISENLSEDEAYSFDAATPADDSEETTEKNESVFLQNDKMLICNISGLDIDKLYVSTSTGSLQNSEILGFDDLYDGQAFAYKLVDIDELKKAGILKFKVSIVTRGKRSIDFGEVEVIDPTNIKLILTSDTEKGYYMYLE